MLNNFNIQVYNHVKEYNLNEHQRHIDHNLGKSEC